MIFKLYIYIININTKKKTISVMIAKKNNKKETEKLIRRMGVIILNLKYEKCFVSERLRKDGTTYFKMTPIIPFYRNIYEINSEVVGVEKNNKIVFLSHSMEDIELYIAINEKDCRKLFNNLMSGPDDELLI